MKRIFFVAAILMAAFSANAQTAYDAYNFSKTNYAGTARSMAVGNAMTALGGDLGAIVLNPAGSAVFNYSEFALTPSMSLSSVGASYSPEGQSAFGLRNHSYREQFNMPNAGVVLNFNTNHSGLKGWSFSFVSTQTDNYFSFGRATGRTDKTSLLGSLAAGMCGIDEYAFARNDAYAPKNNPSDHPDWDLINAYKSGQVSNVFGNYYIGNNEMMGHDKDGNIISYVPDYLAQTSDEYYYGTKNDVIVNSSLNFDDRFYLGFTLGMPLARYRYSSNFVESAENPLSFPVSFGSGATGYFKNATYSYNYSANYDGLYAKVGVIMKPASFLRLGFAFQSPTAYSITESWNYSGTIKYDGNVQGGSASSPDGEYSYCLRSPYVVNAGAAFTLGPFGFLSVDYELSDYGIMRFRDRHGDYNVGSLYSTFGPTNDAISNFYGLSHSVRVGAEFRLLPFLALRAGYGFITDPTLTRRTSTGEWVDAAYYRFFYDDFNSGRVSLNDKKYSGTKTQTFSFGFGYSSPGAFFADIAAKCSRYAENTYLLYDNYYAWDKNGNFLTDQAPCGKIYRSLWNISLTFGWRF